MVTTTLALSCIVIEIVGPGPAPTSADPDASTGGVPLVTIHTVMASAFAILGAVVVSRQSRNPVGWLLELIGFFFMCIAISNELYVHVVLNNTAEASGLIAYVMSVGNWAWLFAIVPAFTFLPMLFPTGRPLTPRWRALVWFTSAAIALSLLGSATAPGPLAGTPAVDNPMSIDLPAIQAVGNIATLLLFPAAVGSITSLLLRFRRSSGAERQQIKWVVSASLLLPTAVLLGGAIGQDASWPLVLISLMFVAIAVTVAMLRYRLYDIDVVINRALVYGFLTAMLAAVYLGSVLLLQVVLETITGGSGLAVAASTLGTAALFGPLRRRTQAIVDRRFFRRKYDASQTLERFGARMRDQVDLDTLRSDLRSAVAETMQPEHVSLWVRARAEGS
jgi:hypothetical protein